MRANIGLNINFLKRILGPLQILKRIEDMNNVWNKSIGTSYTCIAWEITLHDRGGFFSSPNSSKIFFSTTSGNCFFQAGMERICYMFYEVFSNCVIFDFHAVEPNYLAISGTQKRMIHVRWCASSTAASEEAN